MTIHWWGEGDMPLVGASGDNLLAGVRVAFPQLEIL